MDYRTQLNIAHVFVISVFFIYIGINKTNIPNYLFKIILGLGCIVLAYHSYLAYIKYNQNKNPWVNLIHILLVAPLLIYIGYYQGKTERLYFELLLLLGFSSLGYHAYYLINKN